VLGNRLQNQSASGTHSRM